MRISVIVPTRNRAGLLAQALAGIRAQTHRDLEVIVVDDGSIPEEAARNREISLAARDGTRYVYLSGAGREGSGPSCVRNAGLERASGPLIAFCDDDDFWCEPRYLEHAAAAYERCSGLDLVLANQSARRDGEPAYEFWQPRLLAAIGDRRANAGAPIAVSRGELLIEPGCFAHMNVCVFRKSLLDGVGRFRHDVRYAEDLDLYVRYVDRARSALYIDLTAAVHNIPDGKQARNASTRLGAEERWLTLHAIGSHLALTCRTPEALRYARRLAGDACRQLALSRHAMGLADSALTWARLAGGWRLSLKWMAFTAWLQLRAAIAPAR